MGGMGDTVLVSHELTLHIFWADLNQQITGQAQIKFARFGLAATRLRRLPFEFHWSAFEVKGIRVEVNFFRPGDGVVAGFRQLENATWRSEGVARAVGVAAGS